MVKRCGWAGPDQIYLDYHDHEWGVPVYDDRLLFEFLILEGAQAGLSWITVLKKREAYRAAFHNFDAEKIARFSRTQIEQLLKNSAIIRNRLKIESTISNAWAFLELREQQGRFSDYLWQFVDGQPIQNHWQDDSHVPASTGISEAMSRDLKQRGFRFVGPTICYAYMQAVGMVNDHITSCYRHNEVLNLGKSI
ncbi:DNA-3-methyladenine glycosylase I [Thiohalophilus thiocyanatoxydans]|uniref:DNA-3-methyladenine glycosylase I n=1 Tax=Thiohalophilus thiocyanatoxydans TaxID=381308 RepID=A0A4R8IGL0_9GAMM|nr:DNA-3-methyladenine glycosylase I [Thiohalophilus thiocyanatoxydans]TDX99337.1 DNA-3-methyladenine glycosylase I [Thiohalophilus thiocyanatoxydans]